MMNCTLKRLQRSSTDLFFSPQITLRQRLRLAGYLAKTKLWRRSIIRSVEIMHTFRCNCACDFCSNEHMSELNPVMDREDVLRLIDQLAAHGVTAIIFLGGESMTDKNLFEYIRHTCRRGLVPLLQTNGTLLTKENINALQDAGLFSVTITIHDTIPEYHDAVIKRPGGLSTVFQAIPSLKAAGIRVVLKTLYSRESVSSGAFGRILELTRRQGLLLNVNPIMPVGRGVDKDIMLTGPERAAYLEQTLFEPCITTHTKGDYDSHCPAGHEYLGICPNGEILPCYFLPVSVGNFRETIIEEAQKRSMELGIFGAGVDSCIVAMDEDFYHEVIRPLYSGQYSLPVRIHEEPEVRGMFTRYLARKMTRP